MATHIDTNTWKTDWKTSYIKRIDLELTIDPAPPPPPQGEFSGL